MTLTPRVSASEFTEVVVPRVVVRHSRTKNRRRTLSTSGNDRWGVQRGTHQVKDTSRHEYMYTKEHTKRKLPIREQRGVPHRGQGIT